MLTVQVSIVCLICTVFSQFDCFSHPTCCFLFYVNGVFFAVDASSSCKRYIRATSVSNEAVELRHSLLILHQISLCQLIILKRLDLQQFHLNIRRVQRFCLYFAYILVFKRLFFMLYGKTGSISDLCVTISNCLSIIYIVPYIYLLVTRLTFLGVQIRKCPFI